MNLIFKALQLLCKNKLLTKELLIAEFFLDNFTAEEILVEIASMALNQLSVIKVYHIDKRKIRHDIQIQLVEHGFLSYTNDLLENYKQKTDSRLIFPIKKMHFTPNRTKDYSTRKRTGPKSPKSNYPKTEIDQILESSTYTSVEDKDQSRLEKLLKRKTTYNTFPEKRLKTRDKKSVQGTISSFLKRN